MGMLTQWAENLNIDLDDDKLLILPNGEASALPKVQITFEVEHQKCALLVADSSMIPLNAEDEETGDIIARRTDILLDNAASTNLVTQKQVPTIFKRYSADGAPVSSALTFAESIEHIMDFATTCALNVLFSLINETVRNIITYTSNTPIFPYLSSIE
ncbi:dynein heavy chain [Marasmius sp. AFHP31]|nr:dynein heavy chain [Marasmius sp. AFHP31]